MSSATDDPLAKKEKRLHAEHDISKLRVIQSQTDSKPAKYAMSVGAASIAETCTYPLDLTKTRLQLQGEVAAGEKSVLYRGMFQTAYGIFKEEVIIISLPWSMYNVHCTYLFSYLFMNQNYHMQEGRKEKLIHETQTLCT